MNNTPGFYLLEGKLPTLEERKREVEVFKRTFNLDDFLNFFETNGFITEIKKISITDDRFFYFTKVLEEYYQRPNIDFGCFILNSFQRKHPDIYLGMCTQLSINLGEASYIKLCSPPGVEPFRTACCGFRFEYCKDYKK